MKIPEQALTFINLQRTKMPDVKVFISEIEREFNEIKSFLPEKCKSVLDIGCGVCAIDVFLNDYYKNVKFNLVDKNKIDKDIHYGYKTKGSFYNSFSVAGELLKANEIENYKFIEGEKGNDIPSNIGKQDIIISLLSCGYHYPVSFYLDKANELLSKNGVFIVDIRVNTNGIEKVKEVFPAVEIIRNENKAYRICARRKAKNIRKGV